MKQPTPASCAPSEGGTGFETPQCGHVAASVLTSFLHSLHGLSAKLDSGKDPQNVPLAVEHRQPRRYLLPPDFFIAVRAGCGRRPPARLRGWVGASQGRRTSFGPGACAASKASRRCEYTPDSMALRCAVAIAEIAWAVVVENGTRPNAASVAARKARNPEAVWRSSAATDSSSASAPTETGAPAFPPREAAASRAARTFLSGE